MSKLSPMFDLLARVRAGGRLVTAEKSNATRSERRPYTRLLCELDGETVSAPVVRALIARRLLVEVEGERTSRTKTWAAAPEDGS